MMRFRIMWRIQTEPKQAQAAARTHSVCGLCFLSVSHFSTLASVVGAHHLDIFLGKLGLT